jgi:uncharacterized membrane protein YagU involved in acid resistance
MARTQLVNKLALGGVAGFLATIPMTLVMVALHRRLPGWQRYAIPPKQIIEDLAADVGIEHRLDDDTKNATTAVSHFTYGGCMGVPYAAVEESLPGSPIAKGVGYGLFVWFANYLVGFPAANFSAAATREPLRRSAMMIVAHVVWGAALGTIHDAASSSRPASRTLKPHSLVDSISNGRLSST